MAYQVNPKGIITRKAHEALTKGLLVMYHDSDGLIVKKATGINVACLGVTLTDAASGADVDVATEGFVEMLCDGAATNIVAGDRLISHSSAGDAQKIGSTAATVYHVAARAEGAATADGTLVPVQLTPGNTYTTPA